MACSSEGMGPDSLASTEILPRTAAPGPGARGSCRCRCGAGALARVLLHGPNHNGTVSGASDTPPFEILEHTADIGVRSAGPSLDDAICFGVRLLDPIWTGSETC